MEDEKLPNWEVFVAQTRVWDSEFAPFVRGVRIQQVVGVGFELKPIWHVFHAILT